MTRMTMGPWGYDYYYYCVSAVVGFDRFESRSGDRGRSGEVVFFPHSISPIYFYT